MRSVRKFVSSFGHFSLGISAQIVLGLVSFPILTRFLTKEEYGILAIVNTTIALAVAAGKAGLSDGIIRYYKEHSGSTEGESKFTSTLLVWGAALCLVTTLLFVSVVSVAGGRISSTTGELRDCLLVMAAYLFIRPMNIIVMNLLRVNGKTLFFSLVRAVGLLISTGSALLLLVFIIGRLYGYFIGIVFGEYITAIILYYWFFSRYRVGIGTASKTLGKELVVFGGPLLLTELCYLLLSYSDRYLLAMYHGSGAVGLYSVGYNLAMYLADSITFSVSYAIVPLYVSIYGEKGKEATEAFLERCIHFVLIGATTILFLYYSVCNDLFMIMASQKYVEAARFSPVILASSFLLGLNNILNAGLYVMKRSGVILGIMMSAVALNICTNIVILPRYSVMGAAVATLSACSVSTVLTVSLSFKYISIRIRWREVLICIALSLIAVSTAAFVELGASWANMLVKGGIVFAIVTTGMVVADKEVAGGLQKVTGAVGARLKEKRAGCYSR